MPVPDEADVRWVSYQELADARGIDRLSAVRTARNRRWQKRKGNDGTIRVAVPRNFLENAKRRERENPEEIPGEIPAENSRIFSALEGQITALKGQLGTMDAHLSDVRAELEAQRERAETEKADLRGQRDRAQVAADRLAERIAELERAGERPARERKRWWPFRKRRQREEAAKQES